jgi:hypothetical protein
MLLSFELIVIVNKDIRLRGGYGSLVLLSKNEVKRGAHFFLEFFLLFQKDLLILPLHCVLRDTLQDIVGILNIRIQF